MQQRRSYTAVTMNDVWPHLRSTIFITGAFCIAWAWSLVFYGVSHAWAGENPLHDQLSFGNQRAPKYLSVLLLQYLLVCAGAAFISDYCRRQNATWSTAAIMAVEFLPSPVFAGKLMAFLVQFTRLGIAERTLINLGATWFAACLAHIMPMLMILDDNHYGILERYHLKRFSNIVQDTLGFGLGIAWNVLLSQFAPEDRSQWSFIHLIALTSYLLTVSLIAFRLAATAKEPPVTVQERLQALAAFAMNVVVAFTLVIFLNALLAPGWIGSLESLAILLTVSAVMSTIVATTDLDDVSVQLHERLHDGPIAGFCQFLVLVPCVWCCCPWVLVLWLLANNTENMGVKEQWFSLIAMVFGLSASIEASGILTTVTDTLASSLGICDIKHCPHKWIFVLLQTLLAMITTCVLLAAISPLSEQTHVPMTPRDEEAALREDQSLLRHPLTSRK